VTAQIALSKGFVTLVDEADVEHLCAVRWHVQQTMPGRFYAIRRPFPSGATVLMHREIMDAPVGMTVDHINGDTLDNRRANLRLATNAENSRNRRPIGEIPFSGVTRMRSGRFKALVWPGGKGIYLGAYDMPEQAAGAYNAAAAFIYGEFARLNPVETDWTALERLSQTKLSRLERLRAQATKNESESLGSTCKNKRSKWPRPSMNR
jgi:hypothetical protein